MKEITTILSFGLGSVILLATLPGVLEILLVTVGAALKGRKTVSATRRKCRLAAVIPAHDEAGLIGRCVTSIAASTASGAQCEIVVVADNCVDETARLASEAGARVLVRCDPARRGKGYALRYAFDWLRAEGIDAFLVVDADSIVSPNLIPEVAARLSAGAAAVQCRYRVANDSASFRTRLMDVAFLAFNVVRPKGRSGWGLSAGIMGNGFALHAEILQRVPYHADSIVEDLEYHLRLVASSECVEFIDQATVFGDIPPDGDAARTQRSRWEGGRLRMAREWVPRLAAGVARGQWRLLESLVDLVTLPLTYQILLLCVALFLPPPFRAYAAVGLGLTAVHVLVASLLGGHPWKTLLALGAAPFYILWKVTTLAGVVSASRRGAHWVRTGRDNDAGLGIAK
jgi:cellulose synthase/poly-beta-1,6-N-acetylglucosamine synthase-like glycosyltransferase